MGRMGWEGFLQTERRELARRREGHLRRALGFPLAGETAEQLDRKGERNRAKAERGLVTIADENGAITHKHIDDLSRLDMQSRTAAEWVTAKWLQERLECARKRESAPQYPSIYQAEPLCTPPPRGSAQRAYRKVARRSPRSAGLLSPRPHHTRRSEPSRRPEALLPTRKRSGTARVLQGIHQDPYLFVDPLEDPSHVQGL